MNFRVLKAFRLLIVLFLSAFSSPSCVMQAEFDLSPESRLPGWFATPSGLSREDVKVSLKSYLVGPAEVVVKDKSGKVVILLPLEKRPLGEPFNNTYPHYVVGMANGVVEVIEFKEKGGVFHISDDPVIRRKAAIQTGGDQK